MGILIDASVLIAIERRGLDVEERVRGQETEEFFLSAITASELLHGVHRTRDPEIRARRTAFVKGVLEHFPLLPVDLATARLHAQVWEGPGGRQP